MIRKLRTRFTILVLVGLLLITLGVVFSLNYANWVSLTQQTKASLQVLSDSGGKRPGLLRKDPPPAPDAQAANDEIAPSDEASPPPQDAPTDEHAPTLSPSGQPHSDTASYANLSNFYAVELDHAGEVTHWFSDRSDLYADDQVRALVASLQDEVQPFGRIGSQFYMHTPRPYGAQLVVLDARLELASAKRLLLASSLTGLVGFLLMGLGAVLLVRRMTQPVQVAFDKQKQFVWDASHELKTPLAVISANAEVLAGELGESEWISYIQSELSRTNALVQSLLTLAHMDEGSLVATHQSFDLSQAILAVALPFESAVFEADKALQLNIPDALHYTGDAAMIQQLVVILLSNAMKYSDPKGKITLTLQAKGDRRVLQVYNTGEGLAPEELARIFDRFYRVDRARNREALGSGLGLAIAKTIVEAHRGKITAESREGSWALFTVTL